MRPLNITLTLSTQIITGFYYWQKLHEPAPHCHNSVSNVLIRQDQIIHLFNMFWNVGVTGNE